MNGGLGSSLDSIRVFQDFFVDIDFLFSLRKTMKLLFLSEFTITLMNLKRSLLRRILRNGLR
jgi:hypothetical protein